MSSKVTLKDPHILLLLSICSNEFILKCEKNNVARFWKGRMQIVTLYGTRSAVASGKSLYRVEMSLRSLIYTRDLLRVARENSLVSYPILDPCRGCVGIGGQVGMQFQTGGGCGLGWNQVVCL